MKRLNSIRNIIKKDSFLYLVIKDLIKCYFKILNFFRSQAFSISTNALRLKKYANLHNGERCFIIGTGPSLKIEDLEKLNNETTFATHRIFNIYGKTDWRPTYYVAQDLKLINKYKDKINMILSPKFIPININWKSRKKLIDSCIYFYLKKEDFYPSLPSFSDDASKKIYEGFTVTYSTIQLAAYMGFNEIYLLGVDFNYSKSLNSKGTVVVSKVIKDYVTRDDNQGMNLPNLDYSLLAYKSAKQYCENKNISIYNATRGGKLEIFERVDFDSMLN